MSVWVVSVSQAWLYTLAFGSRGWRCFIDAVVGRVGQVSQGFSCCVLIWVIQGEGCMEKNGGGECGQPRDLSMVPLALR